MINELRRIHMVKTILISKMMPDLSLDITSSHSDSFMVMHWQCEGNLKIEDHMLLIEDNQLENKALEFVKLAKDKNASLVLTPEYCFPWKLLDEVIENPNMQPTTGKLWCFGMQYISLYEFKKWCLTNQSLTTDRFTAEDCEKNQSSTVIFDGFRDEKLFANVLAYIFINTDNHLTIILQSKLDHMREPLYSFEASGLSLGKSIYLFDCGNIRSNVFCSLICADALQKQYYDIITACISNRPIQLFQPQCNPKPYHETLMLRFNDHLDSNWSFLRLNWAYNSKLSTELLQTSGTDYIHKGNDNAKDFLGKDSLRACYIKNRSKGLNLLIDDNWKYQWTFPKEEHVAEYYIEKPLFIRTVTSASNQFVVDEIYIYQSMWVSSELCPLENFNNLISIPASSELIMKLKNDVVCARCTTSITTCPLIFWDRFIALTRGKSDYEMLFKREQEEDLINSCVTNLYKPQISSLVVTEFQNINKMADYLKEIIWHSEQATEINLKSLRYRIPDGVHLDVNREFPLIKSTMYNVIGNPPSGSLQKGLAIYTKETTIAELNQQLNEYSKKTKAEELGVLLFYPDGDTAVRLFPNEQWRHSTDTGVNGANPKSSSDIGIGGGVDV